ncbi:MAG: T9SS type A sorting domain-containing protein, partial [Paludibacteraceae bacterium]|nr:T9SS type A sorting domain-containing protein [Paludibacteraceae bacterium]
VLFSDEPNKVEDVNSKSILVYPNPVESIIYIDGLNSDADIQILDLKGKTLLQQKAQHINVTNLLKGTYLLKINNQSIKFIKK